MEKELTQDDYESDEYVDGMMEANEPDYYYCICCNNTMTEPDFGRSCGNCGMFNVMQEGYF